MDKETVMGSALGPMMDEDAGAVGLADATTASTMTTIVQRRYGRPDLLESTAVDKPVVGDDDVLLRMHAAVVHPGERPPQKRNKMGTNQRAELNQANGATVTETVIHEVRPKRSRLSRPRSGERRVMCLGWLYPCH
jgi:hypothetical protein